MRVVIALVVGICFIGCSAGSLPKNILKPDAMEAIVKDLMLVDEYMTSNVSSDTTVTIKMRRSTYYQQVFELHHTTREIFFSSYHFYQQHPDKNKALFDTLTDRLTREKNDTIKKKPSK